MFCVIYCANIDATDESILENVNSLFNIRIEKPIHFIRLKYYRFLEPAKYKRFTMIGQSIGSVIVALEAIGKLVPHVYLDTVGYSFTFVVFKLIGLCKTAAYIHYPTISSDMLQSVSNREISVNNSMAIRNSRFRSTVKLVYYRIFALCYALAGKAVDVVMVNSLWTKGHIESIWGRTAEIVYPPCDVDKIKKHFEKLPMKIAGRKRNNSWIISVGQFRPEKDHSLQLAAFKIFQDRHRADVHESYGEVKLIIIGGCRSAEDKRRVKALQNECVKLKIDNCVQFKCNIDYREMLACFEEGLIGLHTMRNEHFGIGRGDFWHRDWVTAAEI